MIRVKLIDLETFLSISDKETEINDQIQTLTDAKARIISVSINENWTLCTILFGELI